jgi:hypothetical protein
MVKRILATQESIEPHSIPGMLTVSPYGPAQERGFYIHDLPGGFLDVLTARMVFCVPRLGGSKLDGHVTAGHVNSIVQPEIYLVLLDQFSVCGVTQQLVKVCADSFVESSQYQ